MKIFTNAFTDEPILLNKVDVWHYADKERLLGIRNTTIYMHYRAYKNSSPDFFLLCKYRNIEVVVVF